jgi:hypothetical protein
VISEVSSLSVTVERFGQNADRRSVKLAYQLLQRELRRLRERATQSSANADSANDADVEDDVLPPLDEYDPSDTSSTYEKELAEEDEPVENKDVNLPSSQVSSVVAICINEYILQWLKYKKAKHLIMTRKLWHSFNTTAARNRECRAAEQWIKRCDARLDAFKNAITGTSFHAVRLQCRAMEQTAHQREEFRQVAEVLGNLVPPPQVREEQVKAEPVKSRRQAPSVHESDPEGIDLASESEMDDFVSSLRYTRNYRLYHRGLSCHRTRRKKMGLQTGCRRLSRGWHGLHR